VAAAEAGVTSAQGGVAAARAQLEKTIIRAPISGTINMLDIKRGDFEQMYTPVVTIANNHALEIVAYVSEDDAKRIVVGDSVTLDADSSGVITKIAPALDPSTKRIEVRVGVPTTANLTNGQSVNISFEHGTKPTTTSTQMIIPLAALKISADSKSVFTVNADGTLVGHVVTIGSLLGDRVVILSGITMNDYIVTDARGLREGEKVTLK
jgi:RND family efflux transporter MFP subunit